MKMEDWSVLSKAKCGVPMVVQIWDECALMWKKTRERTQKLRSFLLSFIIKMLVMTGDGRKTEECFTDDIGPGGMGCQNG